MEKVITLLPGFELDISAKPLLTGYYIASIEVNGVIGNYSAKADPSLVVSGELSDIAIDGEYSALDGNTISTMPSFGVEGRYIKCYNNIAGSNLKLTLRN